ncbi:hypothetical protein CK215_27840 [Mesorhizobium sp. WSM3864]|nr:hypothetical protein CK215_27840 [Mesorhizobium sp. WSM3864]
MAEIGQELSDRARAHKQLIVQFLTRETGITETQARELVDMIGYAPASLLREARLLKSFSAFNPNQRRNTGKPTGVPVESRGVCLRHEAHRRAGAPGSLFDPLRRAGSCLQTDIGQ